jgi:hypothetical protein
MAFPKKHEKSKTRGIRISCVTDEFLKDLSVRRLTTLKDVGPP